MNFQRRSRRRRSRGDLPFEALESRCLLAGDPILENQPVIISEFVADSNSSLLTRTRVHRVARELMRRPLCQMARLIGHKDLSACNE